MKLQNILRFAAIFAIVFVVSAAPLSAEAATFFGPIVPAECNCHEQPNPNPNGPPISTAPSYGCVLATIQNVVNFGITIGIIGAILAIVYAGFTWMMSGGNPEKRAAGRSMILNVVIGLVIVLSAWLIVDFVMKQLYDPAHESAGITFGPWNDILAGDTSDRCIPAGNATLIPGLGGSFMTGILGGDVSTGGSSSAPGPTGDVSAGTGARCANAPNEANLVTIDNAGHKLANGVAQNFIRMRTAAAAAGVTLRVNYAYRSDDLQMRIWTNHGCRVVNGRNSCNGIVAGPCQAGLTGSNHLLGNAVDISGCTSGRILPWLRANAAQYGFYNRLPRDLCHWSTTGG